MKAVLLPTRPAHYRQGLGVIEIGVALLVGVTAWFVNALQRARQLPTPVAWYDVSEPRLQISAMLGASLFLALQEFVWVAEAG